MVERERIDLVASRLNTVYADRVQIETVRWETDFYSSHQTFQDKIPPSTACDLVIGIFWQRLGTPLPDSYRMESGERYPSGTAYEILTAIDVRRKGERPDVYVFRKRPPETCTDADAQLKDLNGFFSRWFHTPDGQFLRAYHRFKTEDEFEDIVDRLLHNWIEENVPRDNSLIWPIETKGSPFRALQPFDAKHAAIYFGRDRKVTRAIEALQGVARPQQRPRSSPTSVPFLLVVGESGAGKSSLVRAGLAPRLTAPGVVPMVDLWRTAVARIGDDPSPFLTLAKALLVADDEIGGFGSALPELSDGGHASATELAALLAQGGKTGPRKRAPAVAPILQALRRVQDAEGLRRKTAQRLRANLLLLVDQLENVFATVTDGERAAFARLLFCLAATRRVWIVATLRADLYPRLITPGDFLALKDAGGVYDLAAPGDQELAEIVGKSAAAAGLTYETNAQTHERLDERLLHDAQGHNTLPLLQFALDGLFKERRVVDGETRLTFTAYEAMGGLAGAIDKSAEAALAALSKEDQSALPRLLRALAVPIHERKAAVAAHNLTVRTLPKAAATADPAVERLVNALVAARIVVTTKADGDPDAAGSLAIAHQRVFESWKRARDIAVEHADFFRIREEVERQHQQWLRSGGRSELLLAKGVPLAEAQKMLRDYGSELDRDTRSFIGASSRRAQRLNIALGAAAAIFAGIAVLASYFWYTANQNFLVATDTANKVVSSFTEQGLVNVKGISVGTVDKVLNAVNDAFAELWQTGPNDPTLQRSKANMYYEFGKNYENVADGHKQAVSMATLSLGIRKTLTQYDTFDGSAVAFAAKPADLWWELSQSFDLMGDLRRQEGNAADARGMFNGAQRLLGLLTKLPAAKSDWALLLSRVYTSLGDMDAADNLDAGAERYYALLLGNDAAFYAQHTDQVDWQRELSWAFSKLADLQMKRARQLTNDPATRQDMITQALDQYNGALCLRTIVVGATLDNTLTKRDLSFTLDRIAAVKRALADPVGEQEALFHSLQLRRELAAADPGNALYLGDLAVSLQSIGDSYASINAQTALAFYTADVDALQQLSSRSPNDDVLKRKLAAAQALANGTLDKIKDKSGLADVSWWKREVSTEEIAAARRLATGSDQPACLAKVNEAVAQASVPAVTGSVPSLAGMPKGAAPPKP
jgi:hypothetical protein